MSSEVGEYGTRHMGICDRCRTIQVFPTAEQRAYWEANHPHEDDDE